MSSPVEFPCLNIDVSQFANAPLQNAFLEIGAAFLNLQAFQVQGEDPFIKFVEGTKDIFGTIGKGTVSHINLSKQTDAGVAALPEVAGGAGGESIVGG